MGVILLLLFIGILLISAEILVPGMILGISGAIFIIVSFVMAFDQFGAYGASLYALGAGFLTLAVVIVEFKMLKKTKLGKKFFLRSVSGGRDEEEASPDRLKEELVGKKGEALSTLAPTGLAAVEGKQYEAVSQDGMMQKGDDLMVVKQDKFRIFVRKA